jgi:hypothetical protein
MTGYQMFITVLNIFNFIMLVVLPASKRVRLWRLLHKHRDEIKFRVKIEWVGLPTMDQLRAGTYEHHRYVECRIDISPTDYIIWKIWEDGTLVDRLDPKKTGWLSRERVVQFTRREQTEPVFKSLAEKFDFMNYDVKRIWSIQGITRWMLNRVTAEPYVMAKLAGIEVYDPLDLG